MRPIPLPVLPRRSVPRGVPNEDRMNSRKGATEGREGQEARRETGEEAEPGPGVLEGGPKGCQDYRATP